MTLKFLLESALRVQVCSTNKGNFNRQVRMNLIILSCIQTCRKWTEFQSVHRFQHCARIKI